MADYGLTPDKWSYDDQAVVLPNLDALTYDDSATIGTPLVDTWLADEDAAIIGGAATEYGDTWTFGDSSTVDVSDLAAYVAGNVPANLHEDRAARTKEVRQEPYGTVVVYGRAFVVPKGSAEDFLNGALAPGSPMHPAWAEPDDPPSQWVDGPRVTRAVQRQSGNAARDRLEVTFVGFKLPRPLVRNGYNETARTMPTAEGHAVRVMVTWGIAEHLGGSTEPEVGDVLDGGAKVPTAYICRQKMYDETSLPGRVLIRCEWEAARPGLQWPEAVYNVTD